MNPIAYWKPTDTEPEFDTKGIKRYLESFRTAVHIIYSSTLNKIGLGTGGVITQKEESGCFQLIGSLPPLYPEWLGDRAFLEVHNLRFPYVGGAMARGIASDRLVVELGKIGCLGFFGSAGLSVPETEAAIKKIKKHLNPINASWGVNLIHTPAKPEEEEALIDLYLQYDVRRVSAAAFMGKNKSLVRYACAGLSEDGAGNVIRKNYLLPKVSRPEMAELFLSPAPESALRELVGLGKITESEASLAKRIPLAEDLTIESDSGGHTDGRPLNSLYAAISELRDAIQNRYDYQIPVRLGCAGSMGTPTAISSAFSLGAAYVLVGSVHQACIESNLHEKGKNLLSQVGVVDTIMTPSADMFEIGGRVQVVKKGTMMGVRGNRLLEIYNAYDSIEHIPDKLKNDIEKNIFKDTLDNIWLMTEEFFSKMNPKELDRANQNEKYKMALVFRWYLGNSSKWALTGDPDRTLDYQIWCSPAMGAFNDWTKDTFLEKTENRTITQVALNLLEGAAFVTRAQQLRSYGIHIPPSAFKFKPKRLSIKE